MIVILINFLYLKHTSSPFQDVDIKQSSLVFPRFLMTHCQDYNNLGTAAQWWHSSTAHHCCCHGGGGTHSCHHHEMCQFGLSTSNFPFVHPTFDLSKVGILPHSKSHTNCAMMYFLSIWGDDPVCMDKPPFIVVVVMSCHHCFCWCCQRWQIIIMRGHIWWRYQQPCHMDHLLSSNSKKGFGMLQDKEEEWTMARCHVQHNSKPPPPPMMTRSIDWVTFFQQAFLPIFQSWYILWIKKDTQPNQEPQNI